MWEIVKTLQVNHNKKSNDDTDVECVRGKRSVEDNSNATHTHLNKKRNTQSIINNIFKKN